MNNESGGASGSVALSILIVLAFLSVLLAASTILLQTWFARVPDEVKTDSLRARLDTTLDEAVAHLADDPTPQSDAPTDPVWSWVRQTQGSDLRVKLSDVSSRIDPNLIRPVVFERTALKSLFSADASVTGSPAEYLAQLREDNGFFVDLAKGYGSLFSRDTIDAFLTPWSYANLNVSYEYSLRKLYEIRTGDPAAAEVFHTRIQRLLAEKKLVAEDDLRSFLDTDYAVMFPVANALPWWNVHYLPELILKAILSFPDYHIADSDLKAQRIIALRSAQELTPAEVVSIVGLPVGEVIYQYIGTRTWFWRIVVNAKEGQLTAVVCRLPDEPGGGEAAAGARFRVVSRRYDP